MKLRLVPWRDVGLLPELLIAPKTGNCTTCCSLLGTRSRLLAKAGYVATVLLAAASRATLGSTS